MTGRDDILSQTTCGRCIHNALVHEQDGKHTCTIRGCDCAYFVMPPMDASSEPTYVFNQFVKAKPIDEDHIAIFRRTAERLGMAQPTIDSAAEFLEDVEARLNDSLVNAGDTTDFIDKFGKGEVRTVSSTGGMKGVKPERYDLIPVEALDIMARIYGFGAKKYDAHNWRKGYDWSKSYASLMRHATRFWAGEDIDEETELPHLAGVAFHAFTLMLFMQEHPEFDDRFVAVTPSPNEDEVPTMTTADILEELASDYINQGDSKTAKVLLAVARDEKVK